jgi:RimJ/RimL family protein N-acetyltransferase
LQSIRKSLDPEHKILVMAEESVSVRTAQAQDFDEWFALFDAVAQEKIWIGREGPLDRPDVREAFETGLRAGNRVTFLAIASERIVGAIGVEDRDGLCEFAMMVESAWRGLRVGSTLLGECIAWARERGCHKVALQVWPHNSPARALYRKFGFVDEAHFHRHYRRMNGNLWDAISMGLILDDHSPGSQFDSDASEPRMPS